MGLGKRWTPEEEELAAAFGLDDEQLAWRRWCIANNCGGDLNKFRQEYPATPDEAFIATGQCVFDKDVLVRRREQVRKDQWRRGVFRVEYDLAGKIRSWHWVDDPQGPVRIRALPEEGVPYVIGGDTAGTGSDSFVGQVLDNRTGAQVAVLQHRTGERSYAEQMYCLGKYYNDALIGVETNYSTYPQMCLEELGYRRFYVRQRLDTYTGKLQEAFGFETTAASRPLIIDGLKDVFRQAPELVADFETLGEMLTFVYGEKWRPEAERGEHDDLVMALAIAHHIRSQQTTLVQAGDAEGMAVWSEDMWEDFNKATPAEREMMLREWGVPKR